ncbi:Putative glyoxalase/Bleomycin resistance protein/Dihydroxybiphenyl dioxygenase [Colletotrichum destructivum]|uniref:Glyoxalase/Bleomycin resistance protein/Dihydroxybiphenyl dioxygenase n=1 Tax=Colletotrichum destructivum TaxID=34406 RepID=A0AAX4IQB3_9PEZI|nr:Putative glyoxalase/Bleomycin resistance protein/Dihydroxybiphenyl dioxygenase [Colletotrichum destructivum]
MVPYIDVSHLPSSASFYSAILQPLCIHYISADAQTASPDVNTKAVDTESGTTVTLSDPSRPLTNVTYGTSSPHTPVLQIREARNSSEPLKLSHVVFSAPSPTAVTDFHSCAVRANPKLLSVVPFGQLSRSRPATITQSGDIHRATVTDLDGNTMEVVYQPPPNYPPFYAGSTVRKTQSTTEEVGRILNWNYDVVASVPSPSMSGSAAAAAGPSTSILAMTARSGQFPGDEPYTLLRRSVTTSVIESPVRREDHAPAHASAPASNGVPTSTVVGSLLGAAVGAAAGAAITYGMMRKERARAPLQEFDGSTPPFQRRATFPDQYAEPQAGPGRYVEVERTVEKIRYPEAYPTLPDDRAPPQYMAKYSQVGARSRAVDDMYEDTRSHHSSRYQLERGSSVRSSSQAAVPRTAPLMLTDYEHRSSTGSRHSVASRSVAHRSTVDDARTYVSSRSGTSQSTVRPPPPTVETILGGGSRAPSRAPTQAPSMAPSRTPTKAPSRPPTVVRSKAPTIVAPSQAPSRAPTQGPTVVPSEAPSKAPARAPSRAPTAVRPSQPVFAYPPATRAPTYVSARNLPPPRSGSGNSHATWEDDAVSVAPSDSISCIGSKTSRRQYH